MAESKYFWMQDWIEPDELILEADLLDTAFYDGALRSRTSVGNALRSVLDDRDKQVIGADLFTALYDLRPEIRDAPPNPKLAELIRKLQSEGEFDRLRRSTVGRRAMSTVTAARLYQLLDEQGKLPEPQQGDGEGEQQGDGEGEQQDGGGQDGAGGVSPGTAAALAQLAKDAEQSNEFGNMGGGGWGHEDSLQSASVEAMASGLEKRAWSPTMADVLRLAGRVERIIDGIKANDMRPATPLVGFGIGNNVRNVMPSELALLDDPDLEDLFWQRFATRTLRQYDRATQDSLGKGPLVICVDNSGSMGFVGGGENRLAWANALFLALARQALRERRHVAFVPFASFALPATLITDAKGFQDAIERAQYTGGGTDFNVAFREALAALKEHGFERADVVFITDGGAMLRTDTYYALQETKAKGTRLIGLNISGRWQDDLASLLDAQASVRDGEIGDLKWVKAISKSVV